MMQFYQWFLEPGEIQVRGFFSTIWNEINYKMSSNGNRFSSRNNDFVKLGNWTLVLNCSLITPIAFSTLHSDTNSDFLIPLFLQQSVVDKIVQLWNIKGLNHQIAKKKGLENLSLSKELEVFLERNIRFLDKRSIHGTTTSKWLQSAHLFQKLNVTCFIKE